MSGPVSKDQNMVSLFHAMDLNGNGYLEQSEIKSCFEMIGAPPHIVNQEIETLLKRDANKDGKLDLDEFCSASYNVVGKTAQFLAKMVGDAKVKKVKEEALAKVADKDMIVHLAGEKVIKAFEGDVDTKSLVDKAEYVGFYLSAHWCGPCRGFTPMLAKAYSAWEKTKPGKFPIIFVSADRSEIAWNGYFAEMPWYAVKFADKERIGFAGAAALKLGCNGIPHFAVFEAKTGKLVSKNASSIIRSGKDIFSALETEKKLALASGPYLFTLLCGEKVLKGKDKVDTKSLVGQAKMIGLYMSAHWCGPCRRFTPELKKVYEAINKKEPGSFQVFFVSADRSESQFNDYYDTMPWHAIDFKDSDRSGFNGYAATKFGCRGIPMLVLLSPDGKVLSTGGTSVVRNKGNELLSFK